MWIPFDSSEGSTSGSILILILILILMMTLAVRHCRCLPPLIVTHKRRRRMMMSPRLRWYRQRLPPGFGDRVMCSMVNCT